ncbi:hypothetical protein GGF50DRAFT_117329 [Schizophyllum commune]
MSENGPSTQTPEETELERKQRRREKRKHQAEALEASQQDVATLRQENHRILGELKNISAQLEEARCQLADRVAGDNPGGDDDDEHVKKKAREEEKTNKEAALHAGKLVAFKHKMWIARRALSFLGTPEKDVGSGDEAGDEIDEDLDDDIKADVALVIACIPRHVRPSLSQRAILEQIRIGQRQMRSQAVEMVQALAHDIFDVPSTDFPSKQFKDKEQRGKLPKVISLLKDNRFLYDREPTTQKDRLEGYMKNVCIQRILRVTLRGKKAVMTGTAAQKARTPYADLLGIREVTLPMIGFAATIAYFVLSSQPELTKQGSGDYKFGKFYETQVRKLECAHQRSGISKQRIDALLLLLNRDIFPDEHEAERRDPLTVDMNDFMDALDGEAAEAEQRQEEQEAQVRLRHAAQAAAFAPSELDPRYTKRSRHREPSPERATFQDQDNAAESSDSDDTSDTMSSTGSDSTDDDAVLPTSLGDGQIYEENHPASQLPNRIYSTEDEPAVPSVLPHSFAGEAPPWSAFGSRENFEQAELFVRYGCTNSYIDQQLALIHRAAKGETTVTMRNSRELHAILGSLHAREGLPKCEKANITVDYPRKSESPRTYVVYRKPILPVIYQIMEDETMRDRLHLFPQRRYVSRAGGGIMRMWDEISSGDDWFTLQFKLAALCFAICLHVYVDATHVTALGNVKYWPVYMWLGNVPKADRNDMGGLGRATLIGFIPIVHGKPTDKPPQLAQHRADVYQFSLAAIFDGVATAVEFGTYLNITMLRGRAKGHVVCIVVSCDYEEMCRAAGIKGPKGHYPCPICLVPKDALWNICERHTRRTTGATLALLKEANTVKTKREKKEILNRQSLRPIKNTFLQLFGQYLSVYDMFVVDPLHQIEQGEWGRHWWPWLLEKLSSESLDAIDESFKSCYRYPDVHHFRNGVTELQYITGGEQGQILRRISPFLVGHLPDHEAEVLQALRALAVVHLLCASFTVHTEETLEWLDRAVEEYARATRVIRSLNLGITFNWPKHHALAHASDIIRRKGPADNYETGLGERLHPQLKRDYRRSSKRTSTVTDELVWMAEERDAILHVRAQVDRYDAYIEMLAEERERRNDPPLGIDADLPEEDVDSDDGRIKLSAPDQRLIYFGDFLYERLDPANPTSVLRKLAQILRPAFINQRIPDDEIKSSAVRCYRCLQVRYICMMSFQLRVDTIRTNRDWHNNGPRYDSVLIKVGDNQYEFGLVYAFMRLTLRGRRLPLACVRRFRTLGRRFASDYIELTEGDIDFIPIESIERAVELLPPSSRNERFTVQDLSADMYIRLKDTGLVA